MPSGKDPSSSGATMANGPCLDHALDEPLPVAASNWLASANLRRSLFNIRDQVGSLTWVRPRSDMIPICSMGMPVPRGKNRLGATEGPGELAYLGASRTPITSFVQYLEVEEQSVTVAAELFATMDDVIGIAGIHTRSGSIDHNSADGQPRTKRACPARSAACIVCADAEELGDNEYPIALSADLLRTFRKKLDAHLRFAHARHPHQLTHPWGGVIMAGSGEWLFLAEELTWLADLGEETNPVVSITGQVAPTFHCPGCLCRGCTSLRKGKPDEQRPIVIKVGGSLLSLKRLHEELA